MEFSEHVMEPKGRT